MANDITVAAEPRTLRGKNEARRLRATGSTPAVVYGVGKETFAVSVNPKEVSKILRSKTGHNTIFTLAVNGGENTPVMIVDDLIDTGGTLVKATEALLEQGARSVRACATHAVLSGPAVDRIESSEITEVVVTNSIPLCGQADNCDRIKQLSVAPLLAKAIQSIHEDGSVSTLFV